MSASSEYGATASPILRSMSNVAAIGYDLGCKFATFAGAVAVAGDVASMVVDIDPIYTETVDAIADTGSLLGCGVKFSKIKNKPNPCGGKSSVLEKVDFLFSVFGGLKTLNSFESGTPVLTPDGLKPIDEIRVGDLVAARDELTGKNVWREVTETYNRQAPGTLAVSLKAKDGNVTIMHVTSEHPFHLQDWDGKVETMVAALTGASAIDPARASSRPMAKRCLASG